MTIVDFTYRDMLLSALGYHIAYFNTSFNEEISMGSELTFDTIKNVATQEILNLNAKYETPLTATFDIMKDNCQNDERYFSDNEISYLMSWLCSKTTQTFHPIYDDMSYPNVYFKGNFTGFNAMYHNGKCAGLTVTFTSTAPWGFYDEIIDTFSNTHTIYNTSEEMGYLYPASFEVTCNAAGTLSISNSLDAGNTLQINNCLQDEVITLDCGNKIITTSMTKNHSKLYNDFNYNFPRLVRTWENQDNTFYINGIACGVTIKYSPIAKVGILV